jgi:hypothetical protein
MHVLRCQFCSADIREGLRNTWATYLQGVFALIHFSSVTDIVQLIGSVYAYCVLAVEPTCLPACLLCLLLVRQWLRTSASAHHTAASH